VAKSMEKPGSKSGGIESLASSDGLPSLSQASWSFSVSDESQCDSLRMWNVFVSYSISGGSFFFKSAS